MMHLFLCWFLGLSSLATVSASALIIGDMTSPQAILSWSAGGLVYDYGMPLEQVVRLIQDYVLRVRPMPWYTPVTRINDAFGHSLTIDWTVPEMPVCIIDGPVAASGQAFLVAIGCQRDST